MQQQSINSMQNVSQLVKFDCKGLNQTPACKTQFTVSNMDITKFPWGRFGALPHNFFCDGAIAPSPWSWSLCCTVYVMIAGSIYTYLLYQLIFLNTAG